MPPRENQPRLGGFVQERTGNWQRMETFQGFLRKAAGGSSNDDSESGEVSKKLNELMVTVSKQRTTQQGPTLQGILSGFAGHPQLQGLQSMNL